MSATALPHPTTARSSNVRLGGLIVLLVAALLASGGAALVGVHRGADDAGFHTTGAGTLATSTAAFVADVDLGDDATWLFRNGHLGTIRVDANGANGKPVFVGVARESQVDAYLRGVALDRVTDFDGHPLSVATDRVPGRAAATPPATRNFWAASGRHSVTWPAERGSWSVVVMNADGTPGVRARVDVGVKVPLVLWLGVGLLAGGAVLGVTGASLVYLGRRRT